MKKIFTLIAIAAFSLVSRATTFTFDSADALSQTKDGYTVTLSKGSGNNEPTYYSNGMRLYAGNTVTVAGGDITNLSMTFAKQGSKDYADLSASAGKLISGGTSTATENKVTDTWSGSTKSVTFTLGATGQRLIFSIVINGDSSTDDDQGSDNPGNPDTPDTPGDLNPDFVYPEPTLINVPPTTVQGDAYSFIDNNILVSCTKGAITASYFSAHAGFDMTFTATKPIKGIAINGFVKKGFEADSDLGHIEYLTPDADTEANPVLVITDVNSTSVTISCEKQLRCYSVMVYFDENPDSDLGGSGSIGGGDSTNLTFDSAEAVYESEWVELVGEENYSIFLYNAAEPELPYFALDIYPETKDNLTGTYSWDDYTLGDYCYYVYGYGEDDVTWVEGGSVKISKSGSNYTITGSLLCDNSKTYNISFTGEMPIYTDDEYYGDESGVEDIITDAEVNGEGEAYDLTGLKAGKNYKGIIIRGGRKYIAR